MLTCWSLKECCRRPPLSPRHTASRPDPRMHKHQGGARRARMPQPSQLTMLLCQRLRQRGSSPVRRGRGAASISELLLHGGCHALQLLLQQQQRAAAGFDPQSGAGNCPGVPAAHHLCVPCAERRCVCGSGPFQAQGTALESPWHTVCVCPVQSADALLCLHAASAIVLFEKTLGRAHGPTATRKELHVASPLPAVFGHGNGGTSGLAGPFVFTSSSSIPLQSVVPSAIPGRAACQMDGRHTGKPAQLRAASSLTFDSLRTCRSQPTGGGPAV